MITWGNSRARFVRDERGLFRGALVATFSFILAVANATAWVQAAEDSAKPQRPRPPERVWLDELPEQNVRLGGHELGKKGLAGRSNQVVQLFDNRPRHALSMQCDASVEYSLGKKYRTFRAVVALDDRSHDNERPMRFRVVGDGKQLWQSTEMTNGHTVGVPCLLDITGVDVLRLECVLTKDGEGESKMSFAVWANPWLTIGPPAPELAFLSDPYRYEMPVKVNQALHEAGKSFLKDDFAAVDAIYKRIRQVKEFPKEPEIVEAFIRLFNLPSKPGEEGWKEHFARLDRWKQACPESRLPELLRGESYYSYAWQARGNGFANTVTAEGGQKFEERLQKARESLEKADESDPQSYARLLEVAVGQSWTKEEAQTLFDQGRKVDPTYFPLYRAMAFYLLPQWHGQPGDIHALAEQARKDVGGDAGEELYYRISAYVTQRMGEDFKWREGFRYADIKPGLLVTMRGEMDLTAMNLACRTAIEDKDWELGALFYQLLDVSRYDPTVWGGFYQFDRYRDFIESNPRGEELRTLSIPATWGKSIAFVGGSKYLLVGGAARSLDLWDIETGGILKRINSSRMVNSVATSSEGKTVVNSFGQEPYKNTVTVFDMNVPDSLKILAGATSPVHRVAITPDATRCAALTEDSALCIWTLTDAEHPQVVQLPGPTKAMVLSPDGKTLAISGLKDGIYLYDIETGEKTGGNAISGRRDAPLSFLGFTGDGKRLWVTSPKGVTHGWTLGEEQIDSLPAPGDTVSSLGVSPDGAWVALGRDGGYISIISTKKKEVVHTLDSHAAAVLSIVFTPDGKTMCSGGMDGCVKTWSVAKFGTP